MRPRRIRRAAPRSGPRRIGSAALLLLLLGGLAVMELALSAGASAQSVPAPPGRRPPVSRPVPPGGGGPARPDDTVEYPTRDGQSFLMDVFLPDTSTPAPAIVLIHGGGFVAGDRRALDKSAELFREQGYAAFSIDYRLGVTPGHPGQMNDVLDAITFIREHADEFGVDPARIGTYGTSAGGTLAILAGLVDDGGQTGAERVRTVVSASGPTDFPSLIEESNARNTVTERVTEYLGCGIEECPDLWHEASPLTHVSPNAAPMLLVTSEGDFIAPQQADKLADALEGDGVDAEVIIQPGRGHAQANAVPNWDAIVEHFDVYLRDAGPVTPPPTSAPPATTPGSISTAPTTGASGNDDIPTWVLVAVPLGVAAVLVIGTAIVRAVRRRS